jgi:hypothetical protein
VGRRDNIGSGDNLPVQHELGKGGLQGSRTAEGGLVKHNRQVGAGWTSSSIDVGSDIRAEGGDETMEVVSTESESTSKSDSDSDWDSGTVTRSGTLVDIRDFRALSSSLPIELRSRMSIDDSILSTCYALACIVDRYPIAWSVRHASSSRNIG